MGKFPFPDSKFIFVSCPEPNFVSIRLFGYAWIFGFQSKVFSRFQES